MLLLLSYVALLLFVIAGNTTFFCGRMVMLVRCLFTGSGIVKLNVDFLRRSPVFSAWSVREQCVRCGPRISHARSSRHSETETREGWGVLLASFRFPTI